ncbi:MAG: four-helix bundle copper-binding protein [Phycisphaerales bacterium]|nr:four-helix bundle copper-binding protein [Phycisphaerales bacterium]
MHSKDEKPRKVDPSRYQLPRSKKQLRPVAPAERSRSGPSPVSHPSVDQLSAGLKACQDCAGLCLRAATMCLDLGGEPTGAHLVATLQDCADICETAARFIARRSPHLAQVCGACANICTLCAKECDSIDTQTCVVECAQACRLCAETCLGLTVPGGEG